MKITSFLAAVTLSLISTTYALAEAPAGYYSSCEGKKGAALLSQLRSVVGPHTTISYDGLWDIYPDTDSDADGKMWDMYSTKRWTWGNRQCGSYSQVGDCYNREHSLPKSWFNEGSPMKSDAFHVYPTDGKVNGQRSNFPYGECAGGSSVASSGGVRPLGRLGTCTFSGYTGKVFEPDDEYKGDFARTYFYMAAAYNDKIANWDSPQLAGNSYPAFSDWSVNMLLKWHRQDPVSQKEIDRNNAVYGYQHNRNPFIDHPEMAEHIWGNKKDQGWSSNVQEDPEFVLPVDGTTISLGVAGTGVARSYTIIVRGTNFTSPATATVSGGKFTATPTSLSASAVNGAGASLTITFKSTTAGTFTAPLTISSGSAKTTVTLSASAVDGLPALPATNISENSFVAHWSNIDGDEAVYSLNVCRDGISIAGYPVEVLAEEEQYTVENLESETTYTYTISSDTRTSNTITVTTAAPEPSIQITNEEELQLVSEPGVPSAPLTINLEIENISGNITVKVDAPFEVSDDKSSWDGEVVLVPGQDYFYLRLNGEASGRYTTVLRISADDYLYDDITATGIIASGEALLEDFESANWKESYGAGVYEGNAGNWDCHDVGVYSSDASVAYEGSGCARFGKSSSSILAMTQDHPTGIGEVSFVAKPWGSDPTASVNVEYSTDGGNTWMNAATVEIPSGSAYTEYHATVNKAGDCRIRLNKTAGSRILVDNLCATNHLVSSTVSIADDSMLWDAYCRDGQLVIESEKMLKAEVYSIDALKVYSGYVDGKAQVNLPVGFYIVVVGDSSKRVVVK